MKTADQDLCGSTKANLSLFFGKKNVQAKPFAGKQIEGLSGKSFLNLYTQSKQ